MYTVQMDSVTLLLLSSYWLQPFFRTFTKLSKLLQFDPRLTPRFYVHCTEGLSDTIATLFLFSKLLKSFTKFSKLLQFDPRLTPCFYVHCTEGLCDTFATLVLLALASFRTFTKFSKLLKVLQSFTNFYSLIPD